MMFLLVTLVAGSAQAAVSTGETNRLNQASAVLAEMRATPEKGIPDDLWNNAACVIVIPSVKKAAFIFGGEYGKGVASCRTGNGWSAPAFMQLQKGSWGAQIGAQEIDLVLLVMNKSGMEKLLGDKVTLGAGASVAAGPVGRAANASTDAKLTAEILSYSRTRGAFAGIDLSGGVLGPDKDSNTDVYGASATPQQILVQGTVTSPAEAAPFLASLRQSAPATTTPRATTGQK
jgi:lipid-binding SYLF domain-containing protein